MQDNAAILSQKSKPNINLSSSDHINDKPKQENCDEDNPWLQNDISKVATSSKKINKGLVKDSKKSDKFTSKLKQQLLQVQDDEDLEIDLDNVLTLKETQNFG